MEVMATITARGLLMPSLLLSLRLTPNLDTGATEDMEDMEDTATTTERGLLMLRLDMEATGDTDMEAMAAMVVMVAVTDMAVDTVTTDKPAVEYPKLSRVQQLNLTPMLNQIKCKL